VAGGYLGDSLHKAGERGKDLTDLPGMFEPVVIAFSVAVTAHHIGQAKRAQYIAHARHASADSYRAARGVQGSMFEAVEKDLGHPARS
jgi:hypothetical protein